MSRCCAQTDVNSSSNFVALQLKGIVRLPEGPGNQQERLCLDVRSGTGLIVSGMGVKSSPFPANCVRCIVLLLKSIFEIVLCCRDGSGEVVEENDDGDKVLVCTKRK